MKWVHEQEGTWQTLTVLRKGMSRVHRRRGHLRAPSQEKLEILSFPCCFVLTRRVVFPFNENGKWMWNGRSELLGLRPQPPHGAHTGSLATLQRGQKELMMKCQKGTWGLWEILTRQYYMHIMSNIQSCHACVINHCIVFIISNKDFNQRVHLKKCC